MEETRPLGARMGVAAWVVDADATRIDSEPFTFTMPAASAVTWHNVLEAARYKTVLMAEDAAISVYAFEDEVAKAQWPTGAKPVRLGDAIRLSTAQSPLWIILAVKKPEVIDPAFYCARDLKRVSTTISLEPIRANPHLSCLMGRPVAPWRDSFIEKLCLRREDASVLRLLWRHANTGSRAPPMTLLGSPGCGRSSLAQLLALKLSHEDEQDVLYLHQVEPQHILVHFFSQSKTRIYGVAQDYSVVLLVQLLSVIEGRRLDPFVIVDGFREDELPWLAEYNLVVPLDGSIEASRTANAILVPSWSVDQVLQLQPQATKLTSTVIRERYARYGGDVASIFACDQEATAMALYERIRHVTSNKTGTLLRYRVVGPEKDAHFASPRRWIGQIESLEMLRASIDETPLEWFEILLDRASATPVYEDAYELTFQALARKGKKIRLSSLECKHWTMHSPAIRDGTGVSTLGRMLHVGRIILNTSEPILEGTTEEAAFDAMRGVARGRSTYWGPAYSSFRAVDAVARCTLQFKNNSPTQEAIALLRFTVSARKDPSVEMIRRVKRVVARYTKLPIVFVFVSPPGIDLTGNGIPPEIPTFTATYECQSPFSLHSAKDTREVVRIVGEPF